MTDVLEFMTEQFNRGLGHSAMNSVRSALSTFVYIDGQPVGMHPLVKRFIKGVFNLRPALPKTETTWDTSTVLKYLKTLSPVRKLDLKFLTLKLAMLMCLLTGQRIQTFHTLNLSDIMISKNNIKIKVSTLLKHSRPGKHLDLLIVKAFAPDRRLCPVTVLIEYLNRTKEIRKHGKLFIAFIKPHGPISGATFARWVKNVLSFSGIDSTLFTAHSTRGASTSRAAFNNVPLATIFKTAGWSATDTFATYYKKPITDNGSFGAAILSAENK